MTGTPRGRYLSFDSVAEEYDRTRIIPPDIVGSIARLCAQAAHLHRGGLLLDAGIGTGRFAVPLNALHPGQIIGADISLPMMQRARDKSAHKELPVAQADLQSLPFRAGAFEAALAVHVLHLFEHWTLVVDELRRVLTPRTGVLLLGTEQGGRSQVTDYYYARARGAGLLRPSLGAPGLTRTLAVLRQSGAQAAMVTAPYLSWKRQATIAQTLDALSRRTYSQMWAVPDDAHHAFMAETRHYAAAHLGDPGTLETADARFVLYAVRWP